MRIVIAALLSLAMLAPANGASQSLGVAVPGAGLTTVEVTWANLTYRGVYVLQGTGGPAAPCAQTSLWSLRCVVDAGPLTQIIILYEPHEPRCGRPPRVWAVRAGTVVEVQAAQSGLACAYLPAVRL